MMKQIKLIKQQSQQQKQHQTQSSSHQQKNNPLNYNSFVAFKKLKEKQDQLDTIRRRLSVLKVQQEKSLQKFNQNRRKIHFHQIVQNGIVKDKRIKEQYQQILSKRIESIKNINHKDRYDRKQKIKYARDSMHSMKMEDYKSTKSVSESLDKSIKLIKRQQLDKNKSRRDNIKQYETKHKQQLQQFKKSRKLELIKDKMTDVQKMKLNQMKSQNQIDQLMLLQAIMLDRQSHSRMIANNSSSKLKKMINPEKSKQKNPKIKYQKLPSIKSHNQL